MAEREDSRNMRILVPVDGSPSSLAAARFVIGTLAPAKPALEIHLLNVQAPLSAAAATFIDSGVLRDFHREEGEKDLAGARKLLDEAGLRYEASTAAGDPAETNGTYAERKGCAGIVRGQRARGKCAGRLLGSVSCQAIG